MDEDTNMGAEPEADESLKQPEVQVEQKVYNQDEVNALLQTETDKRVQQALEDFKTKELPNLLNKEKQESEKLAAMSAEQKAEHELKQREESLRQREEEVTREKLKIEAHKILAEKNLPIDFLKFIPCDNAEICNDTIKIIEEVYPQSVQRGIEDGIKERLKGNPPKAGIINSAKDVKDMNYAELCEYMSKNPNISLE